MKRRKKEQDEVQKEQAEYFLKYIKKVLDDLNFDFDGIDVETFNSSVLRQNSASDQCVGRISNYNLPSQASFDSRKSSNFNNSTRPEDYFIKTEGDEDNRNLLTLNEGKTDTTDHGKK